MYLNYRNIIPAEDLLGRLLGPDNTGVGHVQVVEVEHLPVDDMDTDGVRYTRARCRPVGPGELHLMTRDVFRQWWLPLPGTAEGAA